MGEPLQDSQEGVWEWWRSRNGHCPLNPPLPCIFPPFLHLLPEEDLMGSYLLLCTCVLVLAMALGPNSGFKSSTMQVRDTF